MRMQASTSVGVAQPGMTGTRCAMHQRTTSGFVPGLIIAEAPAFTARSAVFTFKTVPAHTHTSGTSILIRRMASSAASVRNVTSAAGSPPFFSASASGTAFSASLI